MRPRRFPDANKVYELPGGNEDNSLWVEVLTVEDSVLGEQIAIRSVYEFTALEREQIAAGANVTLFIIATQQPPVELRVTDEPLGRG